MKPRQPPRIEGDAAYIDLADGTFAVIDAADLRLVEPYLWVNQFCRTNRSKTAYARGGVGKKRVLMHRHILGVGPGEIVDHRDGNGLNNRRANLRVTNSFGNRANSAVQRNNIAGVKGVTTLRRPAGPTYYKAKIVYQGKTIPLGNYDTPEEAGRDYRAAAARYFGEFARLD